MVATVHTLPEFWLWAEREDQMTFSSWKPFSHSDFWLEHRSENDLISSGSSPKAEPWQLPRSALVLFWLDSSWALSVCPGCWPHAGTAVPEWSFLCPSYPQRPMQQKAPASLPCLICSVLTSPLLAGMFGFFLLFNFILAFVELAKQVNWLWGSDLSALSDFREPENAEL